MPKFIVGKEPIARWFQPGEEVEIADEQEIRNLLRDGRINVPPEENPVASPVESDLNSVTGEAPKK